MKKVIIEEVKVGVSKEAACCGPMQGNVVAETRIRMARGKTSYYGLVEVDGTANFYESEVSIYEEQLAAPAEEGLDEESSFPAAEGYCDYEEFYGEMEELAEEDKAHALLLKYLVCLVRLDWDEVEALKQNSLGKAIGSFDIPVCDAEEEYLEEYGDGDDYE